MRRYGIDVARLQDLSTRGISDKELINIANNHERVILTRDADFTVPGLLSRIRHGVIYISYQPSKDEIPRLARRIVSIVKQLKPGQDYLIIIEHEYIEIYD